MKFKIPMFSYLLVIAAIIAAAAQLTDCSWNRKPSMHPNLTPYQDTSMSVLSFLRCYMKFVLNPQSIIEKVMSLQFKWLTSY